MAADAVTAAPRRIGSATLMPIVLAVVTVILYGWRLADSPLHLHYDEVFFGLEAHSIATTARDLNGRVLPVYFQLESTANWYQPMAVYWSAIVLRVLPLSDAAVRLPTVLVAALNVALMFLVARRVTASTASATMAAVLLMLTPAHYIHSRLAMDYVYPLPFVLGWLLMLLRYDATGERRDAFAAGLCLGAGCFSYIAGTALAPMLLVATVAALWFRGRSPASQATVVAGFSAPLILAVLLIAARPDTMPDLFGKYGYGRATAAAASSPSASLDPLQRVREAVNVRTVSDSLNHYWRFFSPGYLFVTGGSNLTNSTRTVGVFAPAMALLLIAGAITVIRTFDLVGALVVFGLLAAPVGATIMPEDYTIDRHLATLPFAVLLATLGARWLWNAPFAWPVRRLTSALAAAAGVVAIGYAAFSLVNGRWSSSAPLLLAVAVLIWIAGAVIDRTKSWRPIAAVAMVLVVVAFVPFVRDYFAGYPARSSNWFGGNVRGAIEAAIQHADRSGSTEIYISDDVPYLRSSYWPFYLRMFERRDLETKTKLFSQRIDASPAPGATILAAADDPVCASLAARGLITRVAGVGDGPGGPEQFTIFSATR